MRFISVEFDSKKLFGDTVCSAYLRSIPVSSYPYLWGLGAWTRSESSEPPWTTRALRTCAYANGSTNR